MAVFAFESSAAAASNAVLREPGSDPPLRYAELVGDLCRRQPRFDIPRLQQVGEVRWFGGAAAGAMSAGAAGTQVDSGPA